MKIHEYQAKSILKSYGVAVLDGVVASDPEGVARAFAGLNAPLAVVKAQIHAGGRGKGGGVKLVRSAAEAKEAARAIQSKPRIQATVDDSDKQAVIDRLKAEVSFLREQIRSGGGSANNHNNGSGGGGGAGGGGGG